MLQREARALGDPTRHALFRFLADAPGPLGVAELTAHLGLHHNAIRQHLATLVDAGLVQEGKAPASGRGRPRLLYRVTPGGNGRWGVTGPYERLSVLLTEVVRTGATPVEIGRRSGRTSVAPSATAEEAMALVADGMARHGFDPVVGDDGDLVLQACPFEAAALTDPGTVCGIHLGIAEGMAEATGGRVEVELEPHDPTRAGCRLRLRAVQPSGS